MNSTDLADIPSVRLASGVEMQQRWSSVQNSSEQKTNEAPRLIEITPTKGDQGTVITVVVQSLPQQLVPVKLAFNSLVVDTKQMQAQGITSLVATVPPFQHTHSSVPNNVPISICMLDKDSVTETYPVAEFSYEFDSKKTEPSIVKFTPTEKRNDINTPYQSGDNFLASAAVYENFYQQPVNAGLYGALPQYGYTQGRHVYNEDNYRSNNINQASVSDSLSSLNYNDNLSLYSNATSFTGMLNGFDNDSSSTVSPQTPSAITYSQVTTQQLMSQAAAAAAAMSAPTTAQRQQQRQSQNGNQYGYGKTATHIPATSVANYQPYPGLVSRANLKLMGDLDTMAKGWNPEEWDNRRRLVQFWREQTGSEIRCTFSPISQGERITSNSGHIVVSCIYWAERNDCYITSVDCIHLLESLMDIRFSVEEKNRVRRNLEGFRPLTVSKCKPESGDFFKLIMGFPNPKPRNIEKDVKVFPWKTLPYALKKIITKYTASTYNGSSSALRQHHQLLKSTNNSLPSTPAISSTGGTSYFNTPTMLSTENLSSFYQQQNMYANGNVNQQAAFQYPQSSNSNSSSPVYQQDASSSSMPNFNSSYSREATDSEGNSTDQLNNTSSSPRLEYNINGPSFGITSTNSNNQSPSDQDSNFQEIKSENSNTSSKEDNNLDQEYHVFADFKHEN
ncbi:hypothetical protein K501DRAFT_252452 [Backusella circina FSU 941]|nr:hypothetical protein K501DRAFT_252452 [Backusella circina FSU 941]